MATRKRALEVVRNEDDGEGKPSRRNRLNLFELAYQKIEELLVHCELKPGQFMTMLELQHITGFGRTPVHHAVNRLSADTLIIIRPRHGLHIAPIDLARERMLLALRRDMERFVVRLAADRASLSHRNQALHIERLLRERRATLTLDEFNSIDRRIDALVLEAAGEPFLVHTLRPLHTLYRRIGYIHHRFMPGQAELSGTIDRHLAILVAVAGRHVEDAVKASDALIDYMDEMFTGMEAGIDPRLLDCSIEPLLRRLKSGRDLAAQKVLKRGPKMSTMAMPQPTASEAAVRYLITNYSPKGNKVGWLMMASILVEAWDLYSIAFVLIFITRAVQSRSADAGPRRGRHAGRRPDRRAAGRLALRQDRPPGDVPGRRW